MRMARSGARVSVSISGSGFCNIAAKARDMICNPVYCLDRVAPWIAEPPGPLVPVEEWVAAGAKLIEEIGAEAYLRQLIKNLRGE